MYKSCFFDCRKKKKSTTYDSFFTYPFRTLPARTLIQEPSLQASHKLTQQSCSDCWSCFFSLPVGVLTPHVPEPSLTHTCAHIRAHPRRPANMHSLTHTSPSTSYSQSISAQRIQIPEQLCLAFILCWVSKNAGVSGAETEQEKSSLDLETVVRVLGPLGQADMGSTARFLELFFSHPVEVQCVLHPFWGIVCSFSWGRFKQRGRINASPYSL